MIEPDTLLAGPILRRTDRSRVNVWLATSSLPDRDAALVVFEPDGRISTPKRASIQTVKVGARLFVSLLGWEPTAAFEPGEVRAYDLRIFGRRLEDFAPRGPLGLGFGASWRPSFVVPGPGQAILHGSCRKLHGNGSDASVELHRVLRAELGKPTRPAALFLTGDQIYADDVDRGLLLRIIDLARDLVGPETLPGLSTVPGPGRRSILEAMARFTSREADNHLMTIGEFAAMYLLAWSPVVWNGEASSPRVQDARSRLPELRRVLANVPTYMVFDDHEVTDDWFLDENWRNAALETELGRHLVENALAAFWLFQGWGNDPDVFGTSLEDVRRLLEARAVGGGSGGFLLERTWSFRAPTQPPAIAIDTRTSRTNVRKDMELVDDRGFHRLRQLLAEAGSDGSGPLVVVSPTPVFGFPVIELLQNWLAPLAGSSLLDFERWFEAAFERLLRTIRDAGVREVVILSGDVHYALNVRAELLDPDTRGTELAIYQLVSSGLKNESPELERFPGVLLRAGQTLRSALAPGKVRGLRVKTQGDLCFGWCVEKLDEGRSRFRPWRRLLPSNNVGRVAIEPEYVVHELRAPHQDAKAVVRIRRR